MERLRGVMYPPSVAKYRPEQIANMATWNSAPDEKAQAVLMHRILMQQQASTTVTMVNPLDPGDYAASWYDPPADWGRLAPVGRR